MKRAVEFKRVNLTGKQGALSRYMDRVAGTRSLIVLAAQEYIFFLLKYLPGAPGIVLRSLFYRFFFKRFGRGVVIGEGVTFRHPSRISLGDNVIIDDLACLDINSPASLGISIADNVIVERGALLSGGGTGSIFVGKNSSIGAGSQLWGEGGITLGTNVLVAGMCVIVTVEHRHDSLEKPIAYQGSVVDQITIGDGAWLGAGVKVLQGASVGENAIIGAGAVVNAPVPAFGIAVGVPARVIRNRRSNGA